MNLPKNHESKKTQIINYLENSPNSTISEFLRRGEYGQIIFHFMDSGLVRIEVIVTQLPDR